MTTDTMPRPIVLKATSVLEYKQIQEEYPDMEVVLDLSDQIQLQLFSTVRLVEGD